MNILHFLLAFAVSLLAVTRKNQLSAISSLQLAALLAVPSIGNLTIKRLLAYLKKHELSFGEFWGKPRVLSGKNIITERQIDSIIKFKKEHTLSSFAAALKKDRIFLVKYASRHYPKLLRETSDPPLLLFAKGNIELLSDQQMIAIVGTRKITSYGRLAVEKIVSELSFYDPVIVSGFMYGVDAAAHRQALNSRLPTVAVLGYGVNQLFPKHQLNLREEILAAGGTLISEYPPDLPPSAGQFPARNRIIAGMSQAVVVIEAADRSGTFITANFALEEGRLVCAVPGAITSPYSVGTKKLIQQGAMLVDNGGEIIDELRHSYPNCWKQGLIENHQLDTRAAAGEVTLEEKLYGMLIAQPLSSEKLGEQLQLPVVKLNTLLTELELKGRIERGGGKWILKTN